MDEIKPTTPAAEPFWQKLRGPIVIFQLVLLGFVFARVLFDPLFGRRQPVDFPVTVPLTDWESIDSERLKAIAKGEEEYGSTVLGGRRYEYAREDLPQPLAIDLRYVVETSGEVDVFVRKYSSIAFSSSQISLQLAHQTGIGDYGFLLDGDRAYLTACINPRGNSTFNREQYRHNQDIYDAQLGRVPAWLFRREKWRDDRCLWTLMSMPLSEADPEDAQRILERAWFDWYRWWSANFPAL
ncbi:MAG: cyanoexosortase A system-associated protein [Cyanobacteriota bacterium]|nr:cyanoexosortase A system-associated protein [Cyanobacteriota bacterium]